MNNKNNLNINLIKLFLSIVLIVTGFILDKNSFIWHFHGFLLLITLVSNKRLLQITGVLNTLLFFIQEFTNYIYLDTISSTMSLFTFLLFVISLLHSDSKLFSKDKKEENINYYLARIGDNLKIIAVPFFVYGLTYLAIFFTTILFSEALDFLSLLNGMLLLGLAYYNTNNNFSNTNEVDIHWITTFLTNLFVPISTVLNIIVIIVSLMLISDPHPFLTYEFQLSTFSILILNNLFIDSYGEFNKNKIINKAFKIVSICLPIVLAFLIFKYQLTDTFTYSGVYIIIFIIFYAFWKLFKLINKKTFLVIASILYTFPVIGLLSNPLRESKIYNISLNKVFTRTDRYNSTHEHEEDEHVHEHEFHSTWNAKRTISLNLKDNKTVIDNLEIYIEVDKIIVKNINTQEIKEVTFANGSISKFAFATDNKSLIEINYINTAIDKDGKTLFVEDAEISVYKFE